MARAGATGVIPVVVVAHEPHEADPREDQRCDHRLWPLREPRLAHPPEPELHAARGEGVHGHVGGDRDEPLPGTQPGGIEKQQVDRTETAARQGAEAPIPPLHKQIQGRDTRVTKSSSGGHSKGSVTSTDVCWVEPSTR